MSDAGARRDLAKERAEDVIAQGLTASRGQWCGCQHQAVTVHAGEAYCTEHAPPQSAFGLARTILDLVLLDEKNERAAIEQQNQATEYARRLGEREIVERWWEAVARTALRHRDALRRWQSYQDRQSPGAREAREEMGRAFEMLELLGVRDDEPLTGDDFFAALDRAAREIARLRAELDSKSPSSTASTEAPR